MMGLKGQSGRARPTLPSCCAPAIRAGLPIFAVLAMALAACGGDSGTQPVSDPLSIVSGDHQQSFPRRALPQLIVVRAVNGDGTFAAGVPVQFQVAAGGGYLSLSDATTSLVVTTDSVALASAPWVLGSATGVNVHQVVVTRPGMLGTVTFHATGLLGPPDNLAQLQGPDLVGTSPPFAPTLQVAVRDSAGSVVTTLAPTTITVQDRTSSLVVRLSGSTATTQNGIASFPDLAVLCSNAGTTTSVTFNVVGGGLTGTASFRVSGPGCP